MTDIVERLNAPDWWICGKNKEGGSIDDDSIEGNPLPYEAADEIERLRNNLLKLSNFTATRRSASILDMEELARAALDNSQPEQQDTKREAADHIGDD